MIYYYKDCRSGYKDSLDRQTCRGYPRHMDYLSNWCHMDRRQNQLLTEPENRAKTQTLMPHGRA